MIKFITGIPGSGKSYGAVYDIAINFINDDLKKKYKKHTLKETKYKKCLTNINEFEHKQFKNTVDLDFNKFKIIIDEMHVYYLNGSTDTQLEELAKDYDFFNILIVLDEAQNYLNKDIESLVWWLSYHRHFNQDIILITQDLPLVDKKYKVFSEFFYKAIPSSRKLFNNQMIYHKFTSYQMFKTQQADTLKVPIIKELFTFYRSGANNTQKSLVRYYLYIAIFALLFLIGFGYFYFFNNNENEQITKNIPQKTIINNTQLSKTNSYEKDFKNSNYYELFCNKNLCFVNGNTYEKSYIFYILNHEYDTKFLKIINYKYLILTNDKYELFKKKEIIQDENLQDNNIMGSITDNFSS